MRFSTFKSEAMVLNAFLWYWVCGSLSRYLCMQSLVMAVSNKCKHASLQSSNDPTVCSLMWMMMCRFNAGFMENVLKQKKMSVSGAVQQKHLRFKKTNTKTYSRRSTHDVSLGVSKQLQHVGNNLKGCLWAGWRTTASFSHQLEAGEVPTRGREGCCT